MHHSDELGGLDQEAIQEILNHAEAIFSAANVNQYAMLTESQTDKVLDMLDDQVFGDRDRVNKIEDGDDENNLQCGDDDDDLKDKGEDEDEDEDVANLF